MPRASSDDLVAGVSATRPLAHPEGGENGEYEDGLFLWWEGHPGC